VSRVGRVFVGIGREICLMSYHAREETSLLVRRSDNDHQIIRKKKLWFSFSASTEPEALEIRGDYLKISIEFSVYQLLD
jgi:hypothetical protein